MTTKASGIVDSNFPPLSPAGEHGAPNDPGFVKSCLSQLDSFQSLGHIHVGSQLLTSSKAWGSIFRVDFSIGEQSDGDLINRLVCWRRKNGQIGTVYAIGQAIAPLSSK